MISCLRTGSSSSSDEYFLISIGSVVFSVFFDVGGGYASVGSSIFPQSKLDLTPFSSIWFSMYFLGFPTMHSITYYKLSTLLLTSGE